MPLPRRIARLQQLILEVAAETVQRRLADPRLRLVTLTRVKLAPDLSTAVVYYSAMAPSDLERRATARALSGLRMAWASTWLWLMEAGGLTGVGSPSTRSWP